MTETLLRFPLWLGDNPQVTVSVIAAIIALGAAVSNIVFNVYSFRAKNKREDEDRRRKQRIDWLKTLILDSNLPYFFDFFEKVEQELRKLQLPSAKDDTKKQVINNINDQRILIRRKFIELLSAVDENLYYTTLEKIDGMIDCFTSIIVDDGINLKHSPKFEEIILNKIIETRTSIIKGFFNFEGDIQVKLVSSIEQKLLNK